MAPPVKIDIGPFRAASDLYRVDVVRRRLYGSLMQPRSFLEITLDARPPVQIASFSQGILSALASLPLRVKVPGVEHGYLPFSDCGSDLALAYTVATSVRGTWGSSRTLVRSGTPAMIVLAESALDYGPLEPALGRNGRPIGLFHGRLNETDVWVVDTDAVAHPRQAAKALVRMQVERTALAAVSAAAGGRPSTIALDPLRVSQFFRATCDFLAKSTPYGVDAEAMDVGFVDRTLYGADWQAIVDGLATLLPDATSQFEERRREELIQVIGAIYYNSNSTILNQGIVNPGVVNQGAASQGGPIPQQERGATMSSPTFNFTNQDSQIGNQGQNQNTTAVIVHGPADLLDPRVLSELTSVRDSMAASAGSAVDAYDVGKVDAAIDKLQKKDGLGALDVLKGIGSKLLDVANNIGAKILADVLKTQLGL